MKKDGAIIVNGMRIDEAVLKKAAVGRCSAMDCVAACCSDGVWLLEDEASRILAWKDAIKACLPPERHDESKWFEEGDGETGTAPVENPAGPNDTCCVFLQADRRCSLQVVSMANNLGWPGIKPFYCATYPLYTEDNEVLVDNFMHLSIVGAVCRSSKPPRQEIYKRFREELTLILGVEGYRELCEKAEQKKQLSNRSPRIKPSPDIGVSDLQ